ncbi:MAG: hypothetical protein ACM3O3_10735 [Syntrophothermus sp.]
MFDYAHCNNGEDAEDLRIDLKATITDKLENFEKNYFDIVAFTHADDDHIRGFSELFYLEFAEKYQEKERIKINELWVPANVICETCLIDEAKILQFEARFRLRNKKGIKVFSRSSMLKSWFEKENFGNFLIDAGTVIPNYSLDKNDFKFFVHSPFAKRNGEDVVDRNTGSIVVQCVFQSGIKKTDTPYDNWMDIINITKGKGIEERLEWDIFKIPHHCSYTSLGPEKGKEKTKAVKELKDLFNKGTYRHKIVSTSNPIPNEDTDQPPHRQAANFYKDIIKVNSGEFLITMEFPKESKPEPLVIEINEGGATTIMRNLGATGVIFNQPSRRAR